MTYIFMDESGCLGLDFTKLKTSKNFIVTFLMAKNDNIINKVVSKTFKSIPKSKRLTHCGTLHCSKENNKTKIKLLTELKNKNVSVMSIFLNKQKVPIKLRDKKTVLYKHINKILIDRIVNKKILPLDGTVKFMASRRETNKFLNANFKNYLETEALSDHKLKVEVNIKTPHFVKGLQAVDFVSWALFRKHEYGENFYYNIIRNVIVEESSLFGQKQEGEEP